MTLDDKLERIYGEKAYRLETQKVCLAEWITDADDLARFGDSITSIKDMLVTEYGFVESVLPRLEIDVGLVMLDYFFYQMKLKLDTAHYRHFALDTGIPGDATPYSFLASKNEEYDPKKPSVPASNDNMQLNLFNGFKVIMPNDGMIEYFSKLFKKWVPGENAVYKGV